MSQICHVPHLNSLFNIFSFKQTLSMAEVDIGTLRILVP